MHTDVLLDDVEQVNSESREELVIPRIQNAPMMHPSSDAQDDERFFTVDLEASASTREVSQTQHDVAHDDVQTPKMVPLLLDPSLTTPPLFWKWSALLKTPITRLNIRGLMRMATKF